MAETVLIKIIIGNGTMFFTARCVLECVKQGIPCSLENPGGSRLFHAPPIAKLIDDDCCSSTVVDQCMFGTPWRKRTRICFWNAGKHVNQLCKGSRGLCSKTGKPHRILSGRDPCTKQLLTATAAAYPANLAKYIGSSLLQGYHAGCHCKLVRLAAGAT